MRPSKRGEGGINKLHTPEELTLYGKSQFIDNSRKPDGRTVLCVAILQTNHSYP
ncbi:MAG: hypothetical protein IPL26_10150 [Leptospiraceae bacterium]|nr:hypothetical protein [Leptospiraceae bacterium]